MRQVSSQRNCPKKHVRPLKPRPLSKEIDEHPIRRSLEKPPILNLYNGFGDLEDHVRYFELILWYRNAKDEVKCKIFPLTFTKASLVWYRSLKSHSITNWPQFTKLFVANFTALRVKSKSEKTLRAICKDVIALHQEVQRRSSRRQRIRVQDVIALHARWPPLWESISNRRRSQ